MEEALKLSENKTKKAVVNEALADYVRIRKQMKMLEMFGKVEFEEEYDYKKQRGRN